MKKLTFKRRRFAVFRCAQNVVDDVGFPPWYLRWKIYTTSTLNVVKRISKNIINFFLAFKES
jgi:hypothetical protein